MAELIMLRRSKLGRSLGSRKEAEVVKVAMVMDRPYTRLPWKDDVGTEYWQIEKQFWLKYKRYFQGMGFLPVNTMNEIKKIPQMLEKY